MCTNMVSCVYSIIEYFINLFSNIIHTYFYKSVKNIENISSFYEKKNNDISIIDVVSSEYDNEVINYDNIKNYLNHNILFYDSVFYKQYFHKPITVKFEHSGQIYRICLKKLECKNNQHSCIYKNPKILSASIIKNDNEIDNEIDITDTLKEFHGNNKNYFAHIPDVISDLSYLLNHDGKLYVYDMIGNINKYNISKISKISKI